MASTLLFIVKSRKKLKRLCAAAVKKSAPGGEEAWLADNYLLLDGALAEGEKYVKKHKSGVFGALFSLCLPHFLQGGAADEKSLVALLAGRPAALEWAQCLYPALGCAAAAAAVERGGFQQGVRALLALRNIDFAALLPRVCPAERLLCRDEAYAHSDADTRALYRRAVIRRAKKTGMSETGVIEEALQSGAHIGFSLLPRRKSGKGAVFLAAEAAAALAADLAIVFCCLQKTEVFRRGPAAGVGFAVLLYLPALFALRPLFDRLLALFAKPRVLPSLDPEDPAVTLPKTLVTVSSLLPPPEKAADLGRHLEGLYRANREANIGVLALLDPKNAPVPALSSDAAALAAVRREIDRLNALYGGGFVLAARGRVFAPTERAYSAFERKRGAVEALVRLLSDGDNAFETLAGDLAALQNVTYLLALDADTALPCGELKKLVSAAAHPMNRAVLSADQRSLVSGWGCFAPRVEVSAAASAASRFARIMTWGGVSAYSSRVSGRYMDLFGSSVFSGKGLIDVAVYRARCAGAFPEGRVLSHDILEGVLLGTAFVSTVAFSEGFPSSPGAYYRRQHRWVRGDVQNLLFLFRRVGEERRRLPPLARYQLLDNLFRALLPGACALLLGASVFLPSGPAAAVFAAAVLGQTAGPLFSAAGILKNEGTFGFSRVYFSACLSAGARALARTALGIAFLPYEALVQTDAVIRALWRSAVGRRTLEWTTAAEAEASGGRQLLYAAALPFVFSLGLCFGYGFHVPAAGLIVLLIPFAVSNGRAGAARQKALSRGETEQLSQYAAAMWRFFAENVGEEDHFLPPDHVQEMPVRRAAHRTSPTNIGLYLCCALAAADLSLISPAELSDRLFRCLQTVRALPHDHGLLYNWYDTLTLRPLRPLFLSSVDCGNYLVCLTALREGLREYLPLGARFDEVAELISAELEGAEIGSLYVPARKLFSVGRRAEETAPVDSYYDCYMSEARLTSFYAAAKRLVPLSHWAALDRSFLRRGRRCVAASFSGTAFEYLMPALFLPLYRNTYAREGLLGCLWAQRRRRGAAMPWGVSESAFYAFDEAMGYRYRAHGLKTLALKRQPDDEPVFAPYASFLALPLAPRAALANLRRFASLGAYGVYGFYEAVDFSGRARPEDYMIVRSFMAHHVGMSLLAAANALRGDLFVKRFTRQGDMAGALSLLQEKIPTARVLRRPPRGPAEKKRPPRPKPAAPAPANAAVFSNGEISFLCDRFGRNRLLFGSRSLFRYSGRSAGLSAAVKVGGQLLLPAAGETKLTSTCFYARVGGAGVAAEAAFAAVDRFSALASPIKVNNTGAQPAEIAFLWYFEPSLEPLFASSEHPAFSDMGVRVEYEKSLSALVIHRVEKGKVPLWLAVGLADRSPVSFQCDREKLLGFGLRENPFAAMPAQFTNETSFSFPAAAVKTALRLPPGGKAERVLLLCPAADRTGALERLARMRGGRLPDLRGAVRSVIPPEALSYAERFLAVCLFGWRLAPQEASSGDGAPVSALWEQGISGDLPVVRVHADGLPPSALRAFLALYRALSFAGVPLDLVLLTARSGGYGSPAQAALEGLVKACGLAERLRKHGGVHVLTGDACSPAFLSALAACPGLSFPQSSQGSLCPPPREPLPAPAAPLFRGENTFVPGGYLIARQPPRPWSHTLSNPVFGTLLTWGSLGFTWALDSRLNQLTPWQSDPCTPGGGERLFLSAGNQTWDVLYGASVYFRTDCALYGAVCGGAQLKVRVQVDAKAMKKRVTVAYKGLHGHTLTYALTPLLSESEKRRAFVRGEAGNGSLTFWNASNADYPGFLRLQADAPAAAKLGQGAGSLSVVLSGAGEVSFTLLWAAGRAALGALSALPFTPPSPRLLQVRLPDPAAARFASALLLHTAHDTRVYARTGYFQNSGAFGFRDQLQDTANTVREYPARARVQLLRCAAAQFPEGDVLHWFRAVPRPRPHLRGVRTLCADDALWLPWAAERYLACTGETDVFGLPVPFLAGEPLAPGERERHGDYYPGEVKRSLYAHCIAALKNAMRFGPHGLPLMRGGDWNDSFSELGLRGPAESVWLGMFLALVCERFSAVSQVCRDPENAGSLRDTAADLRRKTLACAFNGRYFLRGFYADGAPLGDAGGAACAIDLLPQAFAVFAGVGEAAQRKSALLSAWEALWDEENAVLRLFYPPFTRHTARAGYVNDYPAGVRENAGQYTHAAVWFYMALKKEGLTAQAQKLLPALIPAKRCETPALAAKFLNEPYAPTADVSMAPGLQGRGGWSLYTGAAGWLWRALGEP